MNTRAATARPAAGPAGPVSRGPIGIAIEIVFGGALATIFAWLIGVLIGYGGMHVSWLWADKGIGHARGLVEENLAFIAEYPRSVLIEDTLAFEHQVIDVVAPRLLLIDASRRGAVALFGYRTCIWLGGPLTDVKSTSSSTPSPSRSMRLLRVSHQPFPSHGLRSLSERTWIE